MGSYVLFNLKILVMKKIKFPNQLLIALFAVFFIACSSTPADVNIGKNNTEMATAAVVLPILMDISTSTVPVINVPDSTQLIELYEIVGQHPASTISLGNIGYTVSSDKEFLRFDKLQIPLKNVNLGTMSQRKNSMDFNAKATYVNQQKQHDFIKSFKAMSKRDNEQTDITTALERSIRFLKEPNFSNHKKILVIISDGYHVTKGHGEFNADFSALPDVHIILVGWKNSTAGFKNIDSNQISIFEGFKNVPDYISTLINTQ
jgi:hypothetical protein